MGILATIVRAASGKILDTVSATVDDLTLSKEEKEKFNLEMQRLVQDQMAAVERSVQARFEAVRSIIVSEMESGDNFTKRARPTIVYVGLALFVFQVLAQVFVGLPPIVIPTDFVWAWSGVVGVWSIGRSYERVNAPNGASKVVTGSTSRNPSIEELEL